MSIRIFLFAVMVASSALANADENAASHIAACNKAISEGDAAKALVFAEQALRLDGNNRNALLCQGRAQAEGGKYQEALNALNAAEKLSTTPIEHIIALTLVGNVQKAAGQLPDALATYRKALSQAQAEKDGQFQRIELNLVGDTLVASQDPQTGLDNYLAASRFAANDNERADSYGRIASAYSLLKQHDKAIEYQIKSVMMEQQGGDLDHIANAHLELGRIYTAAQDFPNAEKAINKTIQLAKDQGGPYWEAKGYYYLALAKRANQQPQEASTLLASARQLSDRIGAGDLSQDIGRAQDDLAHK